MSNKSVNKEILHLAVPNIIANLTIPLLSMVDVFLMGRAGSVEYIGAIALGGVVFSFVYWGFAFLRMGAAGLTAQAFGRKDEAGAVLVLGQSALFGLFVGIMLISLQGPIGWLAFNLLGGSPEVVRLASEYFNIRILAAPAVIGMYGLMGWFLGMQNAKATMWVNILINVLNIGFNLLFVYALDMKHEGVAWGTALAQYGGLLFSLFLLWKHYRHLAPHWKLRQMVKLQAFKRFLSINNDMFFRTLCVIFVLSFFTSKSAMENDEVLALNTVLLQFFFVFTFFIDGFAFAGEALVGRFVGSGDHTRLRATIKYLFVWGGAFGLAFSAFYAIAGSGLVSFFTKDPAVIAMSGPYIGWTVLVPIVSFAAFTWDGIFIGLTASRAMLWTMLVSFVVFLLSYYAMRSQMGNHALWLAFLLFMMMRWVLQTFIAKQVLVSSLKKNND